MFIFLVIFLNLSVFSSVTFAQIQLLSQLNFSLPQADFYQQNLLQNFETDELWLIENKLGFVRYLQTQSWPNERIDLLRERMISSVDQQMAAQIITHYNARNIQAYVHFDQSLQGLLRDYEIIDIYRYLLEHQKTGFYQYFLSEKHFQQVMFDLGLTDAQIQNVQKLLIEIDHQYYLFYHRQSWLLLPEQLKKYYLQEKLKKQTSRVGLDVQYKIESLSDLQKLFEMYGEYLDLDRIEKLLVDQYRDGLRIFPLVSFLPPVVRMNLDHYSLICGPNCLNAAKSFFEEFDFQLKYTDRQELTQELKKFDFIQFGLQNLEIGDLILLDNQSGQVDHAAVVVAEGIVFTKNGASKYNPYLLQSYEQLLAVYPVKQMEQLKIFRKSKPINPEKRRMLNQVTQQGRYCEQIF